MRSSFSSTRISDTQLPLQQTDQEVSPGMAWSYVALATGTIMKAIDAPKSEIREDTHTQKPEGFDLDVALAKIDEEAAKDPIKALILAHTNTVSIEDSVKLLIILNGIREQERQDVHAASASATEHMQEWENAAISEKEKNAIIAECDTKIVTELEKLRLRLMSAASRADAAAKQSNNYDIRNLKKSPLPHRSKLNPDSDVRDVIEEMIIVAQKAGLKIDDDFALRSQLGHIAKLGDERVRTEERAFEAA